MMVLIRKGNNLLQAGKRVWKKSFFLRVPKPRKRRNLCVANPAFSSKSRKKGPRRDLFQPMFHRKKVCFTKFCQTTQPNVNQQNYVKQLNPWFPLLYNKIKSWIYKMIWNKLGFSHQIHPKSIFYFKELKQTGWLPISQKWNKFFNLYYDSATPMFQFVAASHQYHVVRRDLSRYVFAKECAIRIDKQQKERYNPTSAAKTQKKRRNYLLCR